MSLPLLFSSLDPLQTLFKVCIEKINAQIAIRTEECIIRCADAALKKVITEDPSKKDTHGKVTSDIKESWLDDRLNYELDIWNLCDREVVHMTMLVENYRQVLAKSRDRETNSVHKNHLQDFMDKIDVVLEVARRLKGVIHYAMPRLLNEDFHYEKLISFMVLQDKLFDFFVQIYNKMIGISEMFYLDMKHYLDNIYRIR